MKSCDYQGYEFGASYPDSICINGKLYDADSGNADPNGDGWLYDKPAEDIPCPMCHPRLAERYHAEKEELSGLAKGVALLTAKSLVKSIRDNRINHTEPWRHK